MELGYFDGLRRDKIAVFPLVAAASDMFRTGDPALTRPWNDLTALLVRWSFTGLIVVSQPSAVRSIGRTEFSTF